MNFLDIEGLIIFLENQPKTRANWRRAWELDERHLYSC
jgi:hypothetical protein